uniref:Uncharacterized protein n=1 Tax=Oryza sativa subsp. japonica TaxID=39947 RepID=Q8LN23_ORYSJ|nr:hypothetical protein [Oryza sativa Japonica Group]
MAAAWFTVREAHAGTALGFRRGSGARRGARRTRRRRTHVQPHGSRWTARASGVRRERLTGVSLTRSGRAGADVVPSSQPRGPAGGGRRGRPRWTADGGDIRRGSTRGFKGGGGHRSDGRDKREGITGPD